MPTVIYTTVVREVHEDFVLHIKAHHSLIAGEPSVDAVRVKGRPPNIDVVSRGDIVLSLNGLSNGRAIPTETMARSAPLKYFHSYLIANARILGMSTVSAAYIDKEEDIVKLYLSPSHPHEVENGYPEVVLTSIKLSFIYRSLGAEQTSAHNIFLEQSYLPFATSLNIAVEKTISFHFVRRYPLIFGLLREKLHAEKAYYSHISRNISGVLSRSSSPRLRHDAKKLLDQMGRNLSKEAIHISNAFERHLSVVEDANVNPFTHNMSGENSQMDMLSSALSRLVRLHVRSLPFKGSCALESAPVDELTINDTSGEPSIDGNCTSSHQLRWEDLPALPLRGLGDDDSQDSVSLIGEDDTVFDSARPLDRACDLQVIVESDGDGDDIYMASDEEHYELSLANQFDEELDDSDCVLGSPCGSRSSSPTFSPESSQEDFPETPYGSQFANFQASAYFDDTDDKPWFESKAPDDFLDSNCDTRLNPSYDDLLDILHAPDCDTRSNLSYDDLLETHFDRDPTSVGHISSSATHTRDDIIVDYEEDSDDIGQLSSMEEVELLHHLDDLDDVDLCDS